MSRFFVLLVACLMVAALPVLVVGLSFEETARDWVAALVDRPRQLLAVSFLLLAADAVLPIPSSFVCTLCGQAASWWAATAICGAGMLVGATVGFALARYWGRPLATRLARTSDLDTLDNFVAKRGTWWLIVLRPLPILAEASILLCGIHRLSWPPFLVAISTSSFAIAAIFTTLGTVTTRHGTFLAWTASILLPVALTWAFLRFKPL